jgi:membrane peptidoglycan carboxypeptidase
LGDRPAAGKTGTTQAARDAWFIGFTADRVTGVWMGYDDNTPLTGVTGGGLPTEIWRETMLRLHRGLPIHSLDADAYDAGAALADARSPRAPGADGADQVAQSILSDVIGFISERLGGGASTPPPPPPTERWER